MAKKKKAKESSSPSYSIELTGLILILIGVIGFGFGIIGTLIKKFAMFLVGTWWIVLLLFLIWVGIYMLYKRKMPKFNSQKLIGLYILFAIILIVSHFEFLNITQNPKEILLETYNNYMERIKSISTSNALDSSGTTSLVIGGGLFGSIFISVLYALFGKTGLIVILFLLAIFACILTFNFNLSNILTKILNLFKFKKKEKSPSEEVPITTSDTLPHAPMEPKPHEPEKIIITSMDELKTTNPKEESLEPKKEEPVLSSNSTSYTLPKFNEIFDPIKTKKVNSTTFTQSNKEILERVLNDFGITAKVVEIHIGPAVTEYELTVQAGTKVNKIVNIDKEIALALAAKDVIIRAPIPGKSTIGIEIPNPTISSVTLREVLESPENLKSDAKICAALGKDIMGVSKVFDLTKMPHLLVAGSTGSGKSVCINGIIASILMRYKPDEVKLVLVDPKKVELTNYNGIPHLLCPVVSDPKKASLTLQKVVTEMDHRFQVFSDNEVKNITGYNDYIEKQNKKNNTNIPKMPYMVVIIDELADLMLVASKEVEDSITRITQLARAAGIHLIVATQRPSTDVITGLIKNNIPSRIAFAVASQIDSRTILDQRGAERLLGKGDMLYFPMGESAPTRIQGCFVNDDEIKRLIDYCKNQGAAKYDETFENIKESSAPSSSASGSDNPDDESYNDVVEFAIQTGKISASLIQRRFRFGYNRAARMMDLLEERGIVGPQCGSKPREVLVKLEKTNEDE